MAVYGAFASSTLGMKAQAYSLQTIGMNIANVNTGGYKATDTRFQTVLAGREFEQSDIGGTKPKDVQLISQQGNIISSSKATDLAISGQGFFVMNSQVDGSGRDVYGRDGALSMKTSGTDTATGSDGTTITVEKGYLVDKNGNFIQGWSPDANGSFSTTGTMTSLRVDQFAFVGQAAPSTTASLGLNLPSSKAIGGTEIYDISLYDSLGAKQAARLNFEKTAINTWTVSQTTSQTAVAQVDTAEIIGTYEIGDTYSFSANGVGGNYTVTGAEGDQTGVRDAIINKINNDPTMAAQVTASAGTGGQILLTAKNVGDPMTTLFSSANVAAGDADNVSAGPPPTTTANVTSTTTSATTTLTFDGGGSLTSPTSISMPLSWDNGGTASITLDVSKLTQYSGPFLPVSYTKDGFGSANMKSFSYDGQGHVVGHFDDSTYRSIYKLPLAVFSNPNMLEMKNGNVFTETDQSGSAKIVAAGLNGHAVFTPNALELSNVDLADQFARMMMTQTAYNASSTVFKTADEMVTVARDLKR